MTTFIGHKIPNEIIEQVNNIPILKVAEVLGIKVKGSKAICFSGHDTIPSLSFSSSKNLWHCFGCSRGGANIQLVMSMNPGFNFVDAVTWLCQSFNINLCYRFQMKRNIITRVPLSKSLHLDIQQLTKFNQPDSAIYEWFCERIPLMNTGCQYLFKRGLSNKTLKYFRVCELKDINKIQFEAKKNGLMINYLGVDFLFTENMQIESNLLCFGGIIV